MTLLEIIVQTLADWVREILMDVIGRRAERAVGRRIKKWRLRRKKKSHAMRMGPKNDGKARADSQL